MLLLLLFPTPICPQARRSLYLLNTKETVLYRPGENLCLPPCKPTVCWIHHTTREKRGLSQGLRAPHPIPSSSTSLLARLYSRSWPESISQFKTFFTSLTLRASMPRSTVCRSWCDLISLLFHVFCISGLVHHTTRCSTISLSLPPSSQRLQ